MLHKVRAWSFLVQIPSKKTQKTDFFDLSESPLSADLPGSGLHHQIRHPRGRALARHWSFVVQDEHFILTDFCHEMEMLLKQNPQTPPENQERKKECEKENTPGNKLCDSEAAGEANIPEPCRCDKSGQLTWLQRRNTQLCNIKHL